LVAIKKALDREVTLVGGKGLGTGPKERPGPIPAGIRFPINPRKKKAPSATLSEKPVPVEGLKTGVPSLPVFPAKEAIAHRP